jgi:predicted alpha/beta-hydrolase family hydrolase
MTPEKGIYKGLAYKLWRTNSKNVVVIVQGAGEFSVTTDGSDLDNFIDKNSYAQYAKAGQEFPFNILVLASYKKPGTIGNASQAAIMQYGAELVKHLNFEKAVLTGYSYGGQFAAGMLTDSLNSNQTVSSYKGSDVWDGYVIMCGKAPGSPNFCAHPDKPVLLIHGDSDDAIPIGNSVKIRDYCNKCTDRVSKVELITIPAGEHHHSWTKGYNINDPVGAQALSFIKNILIESVPPVEIPFNSIVLVDQAVIIKFGDKNFRVAGDFI